MYVSLCSKWPSCEVFRTAHGDQRTGEWREASPPDSYRASKQFDVNQCDPCMKYDEVWLNRDR